METTDKRQQQRATYSLDQQRRAFSPVEIARMVGASKSWVCKEIRRGNLKAKRTGPRRLLVTAEEFEKWLSPTN